VLTDDIVALGNDDDFLINPASPQLCLWPSSVEALYGNTNELPTLTPNWDKRYLDLLKPGYCFQQQPLRLGAAYFLSPRSDRSDAPFAESVSPQEGFMELVANSYGAFVLDREMRAREFDLLARIASHVPLRRLTPHSDPARLPELCGVIFRDTQQLGQV
jgi:hypothetical protein